MEGAKGRGKNVEKNEENSSSGTEFKKERKGKKSYNGDLLDTGQSDKGLGCQPACESPTLYDALY